MYLKRLYKTVVLKGFPLEKERKNQLELKSLKFHDKTQMSRIGGSWSICSSWSGYTFHCSCHRGLQGPRFSRTGPVTQKSLSRYDRTLEVDVVYSILELLILPWVKRQQLTKHCHQHCYWELEDPSFCPDPQCKLTTLHPKWTTSRASWLLNVHSPGPSNDLLLLLHQPTDLVLGFLSMVIPTTLLLKKTPFQWTTVTQEAFSHHDVAFTSTPVLLCPDLAQPFIVQSRVF